MNIMFGLPRREASNKKNQGLVPKSPKYVFCFKGLRQTLIENLEWLMIVPFQSNFIPFLLPCLMDSSTQGHFEATIWRQPAKVGSKRFQIVPLICPELGYGYNPKVSLKNTPQKEASISIGTSWRPCPKSQLILWSRLGTDETQDAQQSTSYSNMDH